MTIESLKNGSGVKATILIDDKPVTFCLGLFAKEKLFQKEEGELEYEYGFLSEDQELYTDNFYSGGTTGFGRNQSDIHPVIWEGTKFNINGRLLVLVSTDLEEINRIARQQQLKAQDERAEWIKSQQEKTRKFNELPKEVFLFEEKGIKFYLVRSEAEFNPHRSSTIRHYVSVEFVLPDGTRKDNLRLYDFTTKDGKLQVRKFFGEFKWLYGDIAFQYNEKMAKELLQTLTHMFNSKKKDYEAVLK